MSLKDNVELLFSNLRYNESTALENGDIRLTIGLQDRIIKMISQYEKSIQAENENAVTRFL
ncbi:MAG: hypothetical protein RLZZ86_184 [Cyanobacteriota bacterium]